MLQALRQESSSLDVQANKCKWCKKAYQQTKVDQLYCSAKCRQAAYRHRKHYEHSNSYREEQALLVTVCEYCQGTFWAKRRHARFCSISCRSLAHRHMKHSLLDVLSIVYGIPEVKAADVVETQPIGELRRIVERAGYIYSPTLRGWSKAE